MERTQTYNPITGEGCTSCARLPFSAIELGWIDHQVPFDCYNEKIFTDLRDCGFSVRTYLHRLHLRYTKVNLEIVRRELIKARCRHDLSFALLLSFISKTRTRSIQRTYSLH